ncbi:MAG: DUF302 domain-containing protein [Crocinitomicaceae bacterium]|nr:DUF302 domain-containing protein [Crocinitomicaceae bacterium]
MNYQFSKTISASFDETVENLSSSLKESGFGISLHTEISQTFKDKFVVYLRPSMIIGACNQKIGREVLNIEETKEILHPCVIAIQELDDGFIKVSSSDLIYTSSSEQKIQPEPFEIRVQKLLQSIIENL